MRKKFWTHQNFGLYFFASCWVLYTFFRFGIFVVRPPGFIPTDFNVFYSAVERLDAGHFFRIYNAQEESPFKYSPVFLLFFKFSFALFDKKAAWALWTYFSSAIFAFFLAKLFSQYFEAKKNQIVSLNRLGLSPSLNLSSLLIACLCAWHGYLLHYSYGQADVLLLGIFFASIYFQKKNPGISGICWSIIVLTKTQYLLLGAYFLLNHENFKIIFLSFLAAITFWMSLCIVHLSPETTLYLFKKWIESLSQQSALFMTGNLNQSLAAIVARVLDHRQWVHSLNLIFFISISLIFFILSHRLRSRAEFKYDHPLEKIWLAIVFYLLVSPLSWRWLSFIWMPILYWLLHSLLCSKNEYAKKIILGLTCSLALFTHNHIAALFGIQERDNLSFLGFFGMINLLLFILLWMILIKKITSKTIANSDLKNL